MIRKLHLWLSVPFGIVITMICFSGAMLVFEKEIVASAYSDQMRVEPQGREALPVGRVAAIVAGTLPEGVSVTGVTVYPDPQRAYEVGISKPRHATVMVNQYTGEIRGRKERPAFFATMFSLHRWLLDTGRPVGRPAWGKLVVGVSTIMFVVALVTGVVIWWPRTLKELRNGLKIIVGKGRFRLWRSLHVAGGMYALLLLLAMALTGLTWSFTWYNQAFHAVFGIEAPARDGGAGHGGGSRQQSVAKADAPLQGGGRGEAKREGRGGRDGQRRQGREAATAAMPQRASWQAVLGQLQAKHPHAPSITVGDGTATVSTGALGNTRASHRYSFDTATGHITSSTPYASSSPQGKLRGWIYSVHTGTFGGVFTCTLWILASLLGAALPLTGYYLWIRRLVRSKRRG